MINQFYVVEPSPKDADTSRTQEAIAIEGLKTWKTWNGKALTGFSQGAAGIAYALLRLWAVTQNEQFLEAAQDAIAYELYK